MNDKYNYTYERAADYCYKITDVPFLIQTTPSYSTSQYTGSDFWSSGYCIDNSNIRSIEDINNEIYSHILEKLN